MQSKHFILVGAVALGTALGAAETDSVTTRNGITYTNAVIQRADPDGVVVEYAPQPGSVGIAKLKFANLPDELRKRYNYNATDAVTFEQNQAAGIARRQEEIAQGAIEKKRRHDEFVQQRADEEAALEAKRQEAAAMAAAQMQMGGWYGGYYDDGDWYGIGGRRYRFNSRGPLNPHGPDTFNRHGVDSKGLGGDWGDSGYWPQLPIHAPDTFNRHGVDSKGFSTGLGRHWGDSGHWAQSPIHASRGPSHSEASGNPAGRSLSAKSR